MPITRRRRANPPEQPENNNHIAEQPLDDLSPEQPPSPTKETFEEIAGSSPAPMANGDRVERPERPERIERQEYAPYPPSHQVEGGRRTARGELFRRAPMPPQQMPPPASPTYTQAGGPQAPTHEISLPLGNLLHLAYNPGYTGSEEARNLLLKQLTDETKAGGRARCWNCGSIAIAYDRWSTRSKAFGEIGIAFCEICGVWSVL